MAAPAPTTPFAPPPHVQDDENDGKDEEPAEGDDSSAGDRPSIVDMMMADNHPKSQPCLIMCLGNWHTCTEGCEGDEAEACRTVCDTSFRECGRDCFER